MIRGKGISIAARGRGVAILDGDPSAGGLTGIWSVGRDVDCRRAAELCEPVPDIARKIAFIPPATASGSKAS